MMSFNALHLGYHDFWGWLLQKMADAVNNIKETFTFGSPRFNNRDTSNNILNGDRKAFTEFYREAHPRLIKRISALTNDKQLVNDLAQDAWMKFIMNKKDLKDYDKPMAYLNEIARRSYFKYTDRKKKNPVKILEKDLPDHKPAANTPVDTRIDLNLLQRRIDEILAKASPIEAEVYKMHKYQGMNYREIAEQKKYSKSYVFYLLEKSNQLVKNSIRDFSGILYNVGD